MKTTKSIRNALTALLFLNIIWVLSSLTGCKKNNDPAPTEQERVIAVLTSAAAWQSPIVTVDGVDHSDLYKDFSITFSKSTYTSTAGAPVWKPSGAWVFINAEATLMKLDDAQEVEIKILPDDFIELSLQWDQDTFEPGRVYSVKGKQKFKLKKKI